MTIQRITSIVKDHGFDVLINDNKVIGLMPCFNTITKESTTEETDLTKFTAYQLGEWLGYDDDQITGEY